MPRKSKELPASFDEFAKQVEPETATAPKARPIGGMVETTWSGIPMWKCPCCNGTTFNERESRVHTCKQPKFADEAEE